MSPHWNFEEFTIAKKKVPQQNNGYDCALFVIYFMQCLLTNQNFDAKVVWFITNV